MKKKNINACFNGLIANAMCPKGEVQKEKSKRRTPKGEVIVLPFPKKNIPNNQRDLKLL